MNVDVEVSDDAVTLSSTGLVHNLETLTPLFLNKIKNLYAYYNSGFNHVLSYSVHVA